MERILFVNSRNKTLAGHLYPSHSQSIIMAHGFTSDKCSKGRFEILANTFNRSSSKLQIIDEATHIF
jgi:hypothetical protein